MNTPTDWGSAIAILAAGLVLGIVFIVFFNRRKAAATLGGEKDLERKDLEFKRDALIQQLRDLDENASAEERARLERETAEVLRKLDARPARAAAAPATQAAPEAASAEAAPSMNPAVKGFLWGAGSFAALFALGYFVMQQATPREEGMSPTGGMPGQQQAAQQPAQVNPMIAQLEAAVQKDPSNLQLRNDLAQAYLESDNLMATFEQTKIVLEKAPNDARALTFQALVRMAMGEGDAAMEMLKRATKSDPKLLDSWVALAWMYTQSGKLEDAEKMIAEAAKQSPNDKARLEQVFAQMKQQASQPQQVAAAGAPGELPPGHPPVEGQQPPMAAATAQAMGNTRPPAPADGRSVRVTLALDPAAKTKTGILYVMARNPMGGPPVAVKRMQVTTFPITFDFGSADSMMGQPLPDSFRLEARLDSDGDAATKPPSDPHAMQENVAPGAIVQLALK